MRKWKLGFVSGFGYGSGQRGFGGMEAAEVIASLKRLGYDGIEWNGDYFNPDKPLPGLRELTDRTRAAGMDVCRLMAHEDLVSLDKDTRRRRIERTVGLIQAAGACGISNVGTMTGPAPWDPSAPRLGIDISESAAWEQVLEAYAIFIQEAEKAKVALSSEGVFCTLAHDFYTHRYLIEKAASPFHKINLDPSHGVLYGNLDSGWLVHQWRDKIAQVHLKDAVGVPINGQFVFPLLGEGLVDWNSFFCALAEIDYRGFCTVEFESFAYYKSILKSNPEAAARVARDNIEALLLQAGV